MGRPAGLWAARGLGLLIGLVSAAILLLAARPASERPKLGAAVTVGAASAGAIEVIGDGRTLAVASLRPGDGPRLGRVRMRNRGRVPYRVGLQRRREAAAAARGLRLSLGGEVVIRPGRIGYIPIAVELPALAESLAGEVISIQLAPTREPLR